MNQHRTSLDVTQLSVASLRFAAAVFARHPSWRAQAVMERSTDREPYELLVEVPSPTGDTARTLTLWVEKGEPSVGFGRWHTHATLHGRDHGEAHQVAALLDIVDAIAVDLIVAHERRPGHLDWPWSILDLRDPQALPNALTAPGAPTKLALISWSEQADREVTLADLG